VTNRFQHRAVDSFAWILNSKQRVRDVHAFQPALPLVSLGPELLAARGSPMLFGAFGKEVRVSVHGG